jgi:hypothetical protein
MSTQDVEDLARLVRARMIRVGGEHLWDLRDVHDAMRVFDDTADDIVGRVRRGDIDGVDDALTFLEADPWCFRSGYAKERVLRALGRARLEGSQRFRGAAVVRAYVLGRDRREFRRVGALARTLDGEVRPFLLETIRAGRPTAARHALWLLVGLPGLDVTSHDVRRAQAMVLDAHVECIGGDEWLAAAARRLCTGEWRREVIARALTGDRAALRVLAALPPAPLSKTERRLLADVVGLSVTTGEWDLPLETLAALVRRSP